MHSDRVDLHMPDAPPPRLTGRGVALVAAVYVVMALFYTVAIA